MNRSTFASIMNLRAALPWALCALPLVGALAYAASGEFAVTKQTTGAPTKTERLLVNKANGSGVQVRETVPSKIAVGEMAQVQLELAGVSSAEGATVQVVEAATGRVLHDAQLKAGAAHRVVVPFAGYLDGVHYLNVITSQAGRTSVQQVALKVGTGTVRLQKNGVDVVTPSGERIVSMPAN